MTPSSVLEAGRKERERFKIFGRSQGMSLRVVHFEGTPDPIEDFRGLEIDCQSFIDDRVFRAMLRALADEYGRVGAVVTESKLLEILGEHDAST